MTSIEWDYGKTRITPEEIVEAIAARTPTDAWEAVSARLADLVVEVFCERHGAWEPEDSDCSGATYRFRMTDTRPGAGALLGPALLS
jgi:hypothetical protein